MKPSRLSLAVEQAAFAIPIDGRITVFRVRADIDLSALPKERVDIVQGFKPDHDALASAGYNVGVTAPDNCAMAIVFLPRSKTEARALISKAAETVSSGIIVVDGQKTDGIDSILKDCKKNGAEIQAALSKSHGKIFAMTGGNFADWDAAHGERTLDGGFMTTPGVFSADRVDKGSLLLAQALPRDLTGRVLDLGAGWGFLTRHILGSENVTSCCLIEAEHAALECARRNIDDPRAEFIWEDARSYQTDVPYDVVVMNPPFHAGRAADPDIGRAFIQTAAKVLKPRGTVWLVANRHLPYEAALSEAFQQVEEVAGDPSFKVFCASKPRRSRR